MTLFRYAAALKITALIAAIGVALVAAPGVVSRAEAQPPEKPWLYTTAHAVPKETTSEGSGYFAIIEGLDRKIYVGAAKYRHNAYLVEYDPELRDMRIAVDCQREIGASITGSATATGFAAQAKIHTRNNIGPSGKIYFGTKQGYPDTKAGEKFQDYPGGYPMVYDPKTGTTKVYPIPVKHHGIISVTPDEARNLAYISTCSDERPLESSHFLVLDLKTGEYTDLGETNHVYAFIVVDHLGRAYHPLRGGQIARYDPKTKKLDKLKQTIDGAPPTTDSHLVDENSHCINWEVSPNRRTLYAVAMSGNQLYQYDLTGTGDTLEGKSLGKLHATAESTDCRAMCVGYNGTVWAAITAEYGKGRRFAHVVSYKPGDAAVTDHGPLAIRNPDYTRFTTRRGEPLPWHHGVRRFGDGNLLPQFAMLGICAARDGTVYVLSLAPFTLHEISPRDLNKVLQPPKPTLERKPIAGLNTIYRTNSHSDLIIGRAIQTESLDGRGRIPSLRIASLYTDQIPKDDISRRICTDLAIPIAKSVPEALTLGGDKIAVEGVMMVDEHGDYPENAGGATIYPKRKMFEQIFATVDKHNVRGLPVFCDKHLADTWIDAKWIYDEAKKRGMPLMAGSSLPLGWRYPPIDLKRGTKLKEIIGVSYHNVDIYGFHVLEGLQALAERRAGGETGVKSVQTITGDAVWKAAEEGVYDRKLLDKALAACYERPLPPSKTVEELAKKPILCVVDYVDGLRACLFTLDGAVADWTAAWKEDDGTMKATAFILQDERPYSHFALLFNGIEQFMQSGEAPWPVERTLLTSGLVDELLTSQLEGGKRRETPHLSFSYENRWNWILPAQPIPERPRSVQ
jgi:hypothetical protein